LSKADYAHNRTLCDNVFSFFDTEQIIYENASLYCNRHDKQRYGNMQKTRNFLKFWLIHFALRRIHSI